MNFFKRIIKKPPVAFPLVALFHIGLLGYMLFKDITVPEDMLWAQTLSVALFTICWLFVCDMKKWAALTYMGLATTNLIARMIVTDPMIEVYYLNALFPVDVLLTMIIVLYFKKFE